MLVTVTRRRESFQVRLGARARGVVRPGESSGTGGDSESLTWKNFDSEEGKSLLYQLEIP